MTKNLINKLVLVISQKKNNRLEITSTIGCAMMCDYCPQTLIGSVAKTQNLNSSSRIVPISVLSIFFSFAMSEKL